MHTCILTYVGRTMHLSTYKHGARSIRIAERPVERSVLSSGTAASTGQDRTGQVGSRLLLPRRMPAPGGSRNQSKSMIFRNFSDFVLHIPARASWSSPLLSSSPPFPPPLRRGGGGGGGSGSKVGKRGAANSFIACGRDAR